MTYNWILFDADGTLWDFDRAEATALRRTMNIFGVEDDGTAVETYRQVNALMWRAFERGEITQAELKLERFARFLAAMGDGETGAKQFGTHYMVELGTCAYLIDGAEDLLKALYGRIHLALITNGLKDVQRARLGHSTITPYFEVIVISEEVGVPKPNPGIFDIAFAQMGKPLRGDVLIVGDNLQSDIRGGANYGIHTCWYNPKGLPNPDDIRVDYEIEDLAALLNVLESHIKNDEAGSQPGFDKSIDT